MYYFTVLIILLIFADKFEINDPKLLNAGIRKTTTKRTLYSS